jgi:dihydropyrimidinase
MVYDVIIKNGTVVFPGEKEVVCDVGIKNNKIASIFYMGQDDKANEVIEASGKYVMPGLVDPHTHVGFTGKIFEDFKTESCAAAIGGCTSFITYIQQKGTYAKDHQSYVDMVNTNSVIDIGFHYNIVAKEQLEEIGRYIKEFGVTSFKYLMTSKGPESQRLGLNQVDDGLLFSYFCKLREFGGLPCMHCENIEVYWALQPKVEAMGVTGLSAWNRSRPGFVEAEAIFRSVFLAEKAGCPQIYIVHLSSKEGIEMVRWLRMKGLDIEIIVETCPHYLVLDVGCEAGIHAKVNPPIREKDDNEALWDALFKHEINTIGSDHVVRPKASKEGGIWKASPGFPGTGTILPLLLYEGYHKRGLPIYKIAELVSTNPAKVFGLYPQKGAMKVGADADIVIVDINLEKVINYLDAGSASDYSVYEGLKVRGWPVMTLVRGQVVMKNGEITIKPGYGKYLGREYRKQ